jgi:hypothetical protein
MKQLSQLVVLSSISFISASTSQDVLGQASDVAHPGNDDVVIDAPARHITKTEPAPSRASRSPAVEPRVYVQDESTGNLYYYDYPNQPSHAPQNPPKL